MHREAPAPRANGAPWALSDLALDETDSIPTHPLGVKPLGNKYLEDGPVARASMGTFQLIPDEMLMVLLAYFDAPTLRRLGSTCKFLHAACRYDGLWQYLYLEAAMADANNLKWMGTWRSTFLELPQELIPSIDCSSVYSDVLHRPFVCSNIDINKYATTIPARNQIIRMETMTSEEFADRWTQTPFILTKYIQDWPALGKWNFDYFSTNYRDVVFRAEAVEWTYETYSKYMSSTSDESPLYLFDHKFVEKMGVTVGKDADSPYSRPECFGPDLFEPFGAERPDYRWLIIGPKGSGSTFHKDPNATSAWNAVIEGSKYWITFPPDTLVPGVFASSDSSEVTSPQSIAEWLLEFQAEARKLPGCVEAVCEAGEILHIPSGWWHLVVNIEPGIALTQNFVPKTPSLYHLSEAVGFLKDKPDQVTGFTSDVADPYQLFADRLREQNPGLLEKALEVLEANRESRKRKWDVAVGPCDEDAGGGFSFGFGSEDDEEIP